MEESKTHTHINLWWLPFLPGHFWITTGESKETVKMDIGESERTVWSKAMGICHTCWEHNCDNCVKPGQVSLARTANHMDGGDALSVSTTTAMIVSSQITTCCQGVLDHGEACGCPVVL